MFSNSKQTDHTDTETQQAVDSRMAGRRKLLTSLLAGSGALVLAACGGGSDSSVPSSVVNRGRRHRNGTQAASAPSSASASTPASSTNASSTSTTPVRSTIGAAEQQMQMSHQARPAYVAESPQFPWADAPIVYDPLPPPGITALMGFGDIHYAQGAPTPLSGDSVQIRNFKTYILTASGQLQLVQNPDSVIGAQYYPDYRNDTTFAAQMSSSGGVTTAVLDPNMTFHFFPSERVAIDPSNVKGVVVALEAKVSSPSGASDPNLNSTYLMGVGADWWTAVDAQWDNQTTNPGVGDGRYVFLTNQWQGFTFTSLTNASAAIAAISFDC